VKLLESVEKAWLTLDPHVSVPYSVHSLQVHTEAANAGVAWANTDRHRIKNIGSMHNGSHLEFGLQAGLDLSMKLTLLEKQVVFTAFTSDTR
jgi:hypothetical protein